MAALSVQVPYPVFYDRDGQPLDNGNIYIGVANLDPVTNPIQVYYDEALTVSASQPLKTSNGYVYRNGTPAQLYVDAVNFSILVKDSKNLLVYSFPEGTGIGPNASGVAFTGFKGQTGYVSDIAEDDGSDWIGFQPAGIDAVARSAQDKLRETISVMDFGAVGDGVTDDTNAIQNAIDYLGSDGTLEFPDGVYKVTSTLTLSGSGVWLQGSLNSLIKRYGAFEIFNVTGSYNKISDMQLSGNKVSYPYPAYARSAIVMVSGDFNIIVGCQVEDGNSHGILFRTGGAPQFNLVDGNIVLNCEEVGIAHDGGTDNRIVNNHVSGCGFEGITLDQNSYRCIVDGNRLNANCLNGGVGGIGVDWTDLSVISNNVITDSGAINGITFQNNIGPSNNNVISGNVFDGNPAYAIELKTNTGGSCAGNVITGNMFRTAGSVKIDSGCQDNVLSGNSYTAFPVVDTDSYNRIDNGLVSFLAQNTVARVGVTGNGTAYTVPFNNVAQERFVTSTGSFNTSTGVFTSPITALYSFSACAEITSVSTASSMLIEIVTSAGTFSKVYQANNSVTFGGAVSGSLILKEGQTAYVQVTVFGGTLSFGVTANANANFFSAVLVG